MSIIRSLIETDLYKLSMGEVAFFQFPEVYASYQLFNRGNHQFPPGFAKSLENEIAEMENLTLTNDEKEFLLHECPWLKPAYLDWLGTYRFDPKEVKVFQIGGLGISINGPWYRAIMWEVPLMATICELYYKLTGQKANDSWYEKAGQKAKGLQEYGVKWADFGTRRAYSRKIHDGVLEASFPYRSIINPAGLVGTSCAYLAYKYNLKPIGTMAHELTEIMGAIFGYPIANKTVLESWTKEFDGRLGTALPDTFTTDVFLRDFSWQYAKQFDGVRHDSGDPFVFVDKMIAHYQKLGIDPKEKTIVFSDGLTIDTIKQLADYCEGKIKNSFGIGTNFTNDVGVKPLNIVIKVIYARRPNNPWFSCAKLSDDRGKWTAEDPEVFKAIALTLGLDL